MIRRFRQLTILFKTSVKSSLAYRWDFLVEGFMVLVWQILMFVFYLFAYEYVDLVAGWSKDQVLLLLASYMLTTSIHDTLFRGGLKEFSKLVNRGELDLILVKPVSTQFYISLHRIRLARVFKALVAVAFWYVQAKRLGIALTVSSVVGYAVFVVIGVMVLYAVLLTSVTFALFANRLYNIAEVYYPLRQFGRVPIRLFPGVMSWIFMTVFPMGLIATVPAEIFMHGFSWTVLGFALLVGTGVLAFGSFFFQNSLQRYASASS